MLKEFIFEQDEINHCVFIRNSLKLLKDYANFFTGNNSRSSRLLNINSLSLTQI